MTKLLAVLIVAAFPVVPALLGLLFWRTWVAAGIGAALGIVIFILFYELLKSFLIGFN